MKPQSLFPVGLLLLFVLSLAGCREFRSPTDPTPPTPSGPTFPASYTLLGQVLSLPDRMPLAGARIEAGRMSALSDSDGQFRLSGLTGGLYTITASREGFLDTVTSAAIDGISSEIRLDFVLARNPGGLVPAYELFGMVWAKGSEGRSAYVDAIVEVVDGPQAGLSVRSDEMGMYWLRALVAGTIQVRASHSSRSETKTVELSGTGRTVFLDFAF